MAGLKKIVWVSKCSTNSQSNHRQKEDGRDTGKGRVVEGRRVENMT